MLACFQDILLKLDFAIGSKEIGKINGISSLLLKYPTYFVLPESFERRSRLSSNKIERQVRSVFFIQGLQMATGPMVVMVVEAVLPHY